MRLLVFLLVLLLVTPAQAQLREEVLVLPLPSQTNVEVQLRRPLQATERLPALILIGGLRRGARAIELLPPELPLIVASFNYPFQLPRRPPWYTWPQLAWDARQSIGQTRETLTALAAHLRQRPDVDPERIILAGVSLGAPFAVLSGDQDRIPVLIVVHGFARLPLTLEYQFARRWEPRYGAPGRWAAWGLSRALTLVSGLPNIEASARRLRADQRVLVINAENDERVPAAAHQALWTALQESQAQVHTHLQPGLHIRAGTGEQLQAVISHSLTWLSDEGILRPGDM